ncbi:MFS transporter [Phytomonospora sp. NPDC050363]|uniref:MFS transporter n=1 Tax=Phytomonospora sp. NPDC050363 TaxID=3155642 RepID=UPI0034030E76
MRRVPRQVWILAANRFLTACAGFLGFYLFLYLTGPRDVPLATAGVIAGVVGAGSIAGNFTGGWFADRYGHRRVMQAAALAGSLGILAIPWLPVPALAVALPLTTYMLGVGGVAQSAIIAVATGPEHRRAAIAIGRSAMNAGTIVGPLIGALLAAHSYTAMFVIEGLALLIVRQVVAQLLPADAGAPAHGGPTPRMWRALLADRRLLALLPAILVVDVVYRQLYSTLPVYLRDSGHAVGLYAALIAVGSGAILCLEIPVALALRRFRAPVIMGVGYGLVGVGFAMFGLGTATALMVGAMLTLTAGEILYKTTATAHLADSAPPGLVARYQGLYSGLATSGLVLAPPLGAAVYGNAPGVLWPVCAVAALGAAAVAVWVGRGRQRGKRRGGGVAGGGPGVLGDGVAGDGVGGGGGVRAGVGASAAGDGGVGGGGGVRAGVGASAAGDGGVGGGGGVRAGVGASAAGDGGAGGGVVGVGPSGLGDGGVPATRQGAEAEADAAGGGRRQ